MSIVQRPLGRERGAVAVEFALILPVLLLILVGTIEWGRTYSQYQVFQGAAREGARCAAVQAGGFAACTIAVRTRDAASPYTPAFAPGAPTVQVNMGTDAAPNWQAQAAGCTDNDIGRDVRVTWQQPLSISIGFWNRTITTTITGVFRCE